jgi:hypothetical protein
MALRHFEDMGVVDHAFIVGVATCIINEARHQPRHLRRDLEAAGAGENRPEFRCPDFCPAYPVPAA